MKTANALSALILTHALVLVAIASAHDSSGGQGMTQNKNSMVRIELQGSLLCDSGNGATQSSRQCQLRTRNGRVYSLTSSAQAISFYDNGKATVQVEGTLGDSKTLNIENIQSL